MTASYIIAAVMVAPALVQVGVAPVAAHMFIFYYAVLSEVSPPTALSPFAAAALTGGNPFRTMMLTWKYTLPAFLVPFAFTIHPRGLGLLVASLSRSDRVVGVHRVARRGGHCRLGVGWIVDGTSAMERTIAAIAAVLLFVPSVAVALSGAALLAVVVAVHWRRA